MTTFWVSVGVVASGFLIPFAYQWIEKTRDWKKASELSVVFAILFSVVYGIGVWAGGYDQRNPSPAQEYPYEEIDPWEPPAN